MMIKFIILLCLIVTNVSLAKDLPTHNETKKWIMSKYNDYQDETTITAPAGTSYIWNDSSLDIGKCSISSSISGRTDDGRSLHQSTSDFDLTQYQSLEIDGVSRGSYSGYPRIRVSFSTKGEANLSGSIQYQSELYIYFNYHNQERNLEERLHKAFLNLRRIAKEDPDCTNSDESF